jgi:hypothetical protein
METYKLKTSNGKVLLSHKEAMKWIRTYQMEAFLEAGNKGLTTGDLERGVNVYIKNAGILNLLLLAELSACGIVEEVSDSPLTYGLAKKETTEDCTRKKRLEDGIKVFRKLFPPPEGL